MLFFYNLYVVFDSKVTFAIRKLKKNNNNPFFFFIKFYSGIVHYKTFMLR